MPESGEERLRISEPAEPTNSPNAEARPSASNDWRTLLDKHAGLLATVGYLYLTAIGIAYTVTFYRRFGVSIVTYSEPVDYVAAGVREPVLFLFSVAAVYFLYRLVVRDRKMRERSESYRRIAERMESSRWYSNLVLYPLIVISYFTLLIMFYSEYRADLIFEGKAPRIEVDLNSAAAGSSRLGTDGWLILLGANAKFLFLYDGGNRRISIVPIGNVARIIDYRPEPVHRNTPTKGQRARTVGNEH